MGFNIGKAFGRATGLSKAQPLKVFQAVPRAIGLGPKLSKVIDPIRWVYNPVAQIKGFISPETYGVILGKSVGEPKVNVFDPPPGQAVDYGSGGYAYSGGYDPLFSGYGGYSSWDYSTPSQGFLTPQYQAWPTYSVQETRERSWEDLVSLGALFL